MSRNIRGYDVMMSLGDVLRAVVANDGNQRFHSQTPSNVIANFAGEEAKSSWSMQYQMENGANRELVKSTLELPRIHSSAELTRHQADTFVGFGLHELSKAAFSDARTTKTALTDSNKMYAGLFEAFEAGRVEHEMLKSGMAPNARKTFESMSDVAYAQQMLQGYNPNSLDWLPTTVNYIAQRRAGYNLPFVDELKRSMNPYNLGLVEKALDQMDKAKPLREGTQDSEAAAKWLLEQLNLPPSAGDGKGEDEPKKGKGKGQQGQGGEGEPVEGEGYGEGNEGEGEGDGEGDGNGEGEGDGSSGSQSDGAGKGSGDGSGDARVGKGSGSGGEGDGQSQGQGQGQRSKVPAAKGKGGKGYSPPKWNRDKLRQSNPKPLKYNEIVRKAAKEINKVAKAAHGDDTLRTVELTDECRVEEQFQTSKDVYDGIHARIPTNLGSMRHALWRLLQSKDEHIVQRYCEFGRWDQRALTRMLAGSQALYKQEGDVVGMKTAVSIILDMSGSMAGEKAYSAAAACIALAETMEQLAAHGVAYEIIGFSSTGFSVGQLKRAVGESPKLANSYKELAEAGKKKKKKSWKSRWWEWDKDGKEEESDFSDYGSSYSSRYGSWRGFGSGYGSYKGWFSSSGHQVGIIQFKGFHDKLATRKLYISQMVGRPSGGTPDSQGLLIAIKDVIARPEPNKIVMVITDGMGDVAGVKAGCRFAAQIGVDVIGVGIGGDCHYVNQVYPNAIYSASISGLGEAAFTALVSQIEKNRRLYFGEGKRARKVA